MKSKEITPDLWGDLEEIRNSMSIEGYDLSDEQLERVGERYLKEASATDFKALALKAKQEGKSYAEIATDLDIAEITVRNHVGKAMRKLGHYDKRKAVLARVEACGSQQVKEKFRLLLFA